MNNIQNNSLEGTIESFLSIFPLHTLRAYMKDQDSINYEIVLTDMSLVGLYSSVFLLRALDSYLI